MSNAIAGAGPVVFLYRWKVDPALEAQFVEAWTRRTDTLLGHGSFGSRLHRGDDGLWYGYAAWPSAEARERALAVPASADGPSMDAAILERWPVVQLTPVVDRLQAASNADRKN